MHRLRLFPYSLLLIIAAAAVGLDAAEPGGGERIAIDGEFEDWLGFDSVEDPVGDATGAFDLSRVTALIDGTTVFLRFDTGNSVNLGAGPEADGTLMVTIDLPGRRKLLIDLRGRQATLQGGSQALPMGWSSLRFAVLPTFASTDFELRCDLAALGVQPGDRITIEFGGSDRLDDGPIELTMTQGERRPAATADLSRPDGTLRVASMNTLRSGLADPERSETFAEIISAIDADVVCFNEEWDGAAFHAAYPALIGKFGYRGFCYAGCGIVSKHPAFLLPCELSRGVAGLVEVDGGPNLVVVSVHFKCCGFAGSNEDFMRIRDAAEVMMAITRMRRGEFGREAKDAEVIVLGDYNHVGSSIPLDVLRAGGLRSVMLRSPLDGSALTWEGLDQSESFWPGRLDWATVSKKVDVDQGMLIDASMLSPPLARVSDHRMLVIDLSVDDSTNSE